MSIEERKKPTIESLEAVLTAYLNSSLIDERRQEQLFWFQDAVKASSLLKDVILALTDACARRYEDMDLEPLRKVMGRLPTKEEFEPHRVMTIAAQFFFYGWHARGAIEDAEKLKGMSK